LNSENEIDSINFLKFVLLTYFSTVVSCKSNKIFTD
jgi:hypothetical protein